MGVWGLGVGGWGSSGEFMHHTSYLVSHTSYLVPHTSYFVPRTSPTPNPQPLKNLFVPIQPDRGGGCAGFGQADGGGDHQQGVGAGQRGDHTGALLAGGDRFVAAVRGAAHLHPDVIVAARRVLDRR